MRLCSVAHCLGELAGDDQDRERSDVDAGVLDSIQAAVALVLSATEEMAECAAAIEEAAHQQMPVHHGEEHRWASGPQEHYPELLTLDVPLSTSDSHCTGDEAFNRVLTQVRLQTTAVKDRYTVLLPALPWIGGNRDDFTGPRLTAVRVALESAVESLKWAETGGEVDLTAESTSVVASR